MPVNRFQHHEHEYGIEQDKSNNSTLLLLQKSPNIFFLLIAQCTVNRGRFFIYI